MKPVMYLDVDDTLLTFNSGVWEATYGRSRTTLTADHIIAAPGAGEFLLWALEHYEVRWLTFWCPGGVMHPDRARVLAKALGVPAEAVAGIRGRSFAHTFNKCDGIDWDEHAAGRPWVWIEDDLPSDELYILAGRRALDHYIRCNVTEDPQALRRVHRALMAQQRQAA